VSVIRVVVRCSDVWEIRPAYSAWPNSMHLNTQIMYITNFGSTSSKPLELLNTTRCRKKKTTMSSPRRLVSRLQHKYVILGCTFQCRQYRQSYCQVVVCSIKCKFLHMCLFKHKVLRPAINAVVQLLQNPGADYFLCLRACLYLYMKTSSDSM
jgi:hypothetical protein